MIRRALVFLALAAGCATVRPVPADHVLVVSAPPRYRDVAIRAAAYLNEDIGCRAVRVADLDADISIITSDDMPPLAAATWSPHERLVRLRPWLNSTELFVCIAHEFGHALGLDHDLPGPSSTLMAPSLMVSNAVEYDLPRLPRLTDEDAALLRRWMCHGG